MLSRLFQSLVFSFTLLALAERAVAQPPATFSCGVSTTVEPIARVEGLAELVDDILLDCWGGHDGTPVMFNLTVNLDTSITSRILSTTPTLDTEALLLIDEPTPPTLLVMNSNVYRGTVPAVGSNQVTFFGVGSTESGASHRYFRIVNIRTNATPVMGSPGSIHAAISISGASSIPISYPGYPPGTATVIVAYTLPSASMAVRKPDDSGDAAVALAASTLVNSDLFSHPCSATSATVTYNLKFSEAFGTAFRKRNIATIVGDLNMLGDQAIPGIVVGAYGETGFYKGSLSAAGLATQGTRLIASFSDVPTGVKLFATVAQVPSGTSSLVEARLVQTDLNGVNTVPSTSTTALAGCPMTLTGIGSRNIQEITVTDHKATMVWEIAQSNNAALESVSFGVLVAYNTAPSAETAHVKGGLAPWSTASDTAPAPRFKEPSTSLTAFTITPTAPSCPSVSGPSGGLNFTWNLSDPAPSGMTLSVTGSGSFTVSVNYTDPSSPHFVLVDIGTFPAPRTIPVSVITSVLTMAATYTAQIRITPLDSACTPFIIPVSVAVGLGASGGPFTCATSVPTPPGVPYVRAEGLAEFVGDIYLDCTGGTAGTVVNTNLVVTLNTNVTSSLDYFLSPPSTYTEALLLIDDLASPLVSGSNLFAGILSADNSVTFSISFTQPGAGHRYLRIVNVRANAAMAPPPGSIIATIIVSPAVMPITPATLVVASPTTGASLAVRSSDDISAAAVSLSASTPVNSGLFDSCSATGGLVTFNLKFQENYAAAFRKRNRATTSSAITLMADTVLGNLHQTETGFFLESAPVVTLAYAGAPSQGTRLIAQFPDVPPGVRLFATLKPAPSGTSSGTDALMVQTDANGANAVTDWITYVWPSCGVVTPPGATGSIGIREVSVIDGQATMVWEITQSSDLTLESVSFGVLVAYNAPPSAGTSHVKGGLAPWGTLGTASGTASRYPLTPRFKDVSTSQTAFTVSGVFFRTSSDAVEFSFASGGAAPAAQTLSLSVDGGGAMAFTAASSNTALFTVTPAVGTMPATLTVAVANTRMSAGTYTGSILVTAPGAANSPRTVAVTLRVATATSLAASPTALALRCYACGSGGPQIVSVTSVGSVHFTVSWSAPWLTVTPASATTPGTLAVSVNCAGLQKGTYTDTIKITGDDGSVVNVVVNLTVTLPPYLTATPATLTFSLPAPPDQTVRVRAIDPGPPEAEVTQHFTADISPIGFGTPTPSSADTAATVSVHVDTWTPGSGQLNIRPSCTQMAAINVPITLNAALGPVIAGPPVSAASFTAAVSPGSLISMFGLSLGPDGGVGFTPTPTGTVDTTLGGTRVLVGDNLAAIPLLYVRADQINAMLPYSLAGKSSVPVVVERAGVRSASVTAKLSEFAPALFTRDGTGRGQAAALNQNGDLNSQSNPAGRNSVMVLYGTGGSQTNPPMPDGALNPIQAALCATQPIALIDGIPAEVQYAGMAPGLVAGVLQFNVVVPSGARAGVVPVTVRFGTAESPAGVTVVLR